jgi:alkanesulfonate monooxygenase SsuD/methylene tetrahydromethanopterin reductase-like flavin-dependent oxidoreductase (luciferase family)
MPPASSATTSPSTTPRPSAWHPRPRYFSPRRRSALDASAWYRSITKLWHAHDDHTPDGVFAWETATQYETILFGSPARVREQLARLLEVSGCNYVICVFAWGTLTYEQTRRSLRLFAEEVMPAFLGSAAPVV